MAPRGGDPERTWLWLVRTCGLGIAIWETVVDKADRPALLLLAAGMMGLKTVIDYGRKNGGPNGK